MVRLIEALFRQTLGRAWSDSFVGTSWSTNGANGNIGTEATVKALSDGSTLLQVTVSNKINPSLYDKLNLIEFMTSCRWQVYGANLLLSRYPSRFPVRIIAELITRPEIAGGR
jgi:hypothetical protein